MEQIVTIWKSGKIQKSFRITYDVVWNIILFFLVIGIFGAIFGGAVGAGYFASLVKDEPIRSYASMERDIYNYEETSKLYFADNIFIGDIRSDLHREEVPLEEISPILIDAVIATEDESFFEHNGVVPKAIVRALLQEVIDTGMKSGGSTLTQQLIKNQILTNEVSFDRKAKEILLAMRLEKFFEKEEILEAYLNVIPYGRNASGRNIAGIQTAAQGIFDIDASELNLPQAAYLAGLPQSPSAYTPFVATGGLKSDEGIEPGLNRMNVVLKRMLEAKVISEQEYEDALNYDLVADFAEPKESPTEKYGYLTSEIEEQAKEVLKDVLAVEDGYTLEDLNKDKNLDEQYNILAKRALSMNGYHIHSTIDKKIYDAMQEAAKNYEHYERDFTHKNGETESVQAAGLMIENSTGRIISFVGGREYSLDNEWNYAFDSKRSPGSTIKPILVYAPALELGVIQPGSPIADIKTEFPDGWSPDNYVKNRYYGVNPARKALAHSYNISTARAYELIYDEQVAKNYLPKLGLADLEKDYTHRSLSIGATTDGVTVKDNTSAFAVLGNNGKFSDAYMIDKITDKDGNIIYEHEIEQTEVFSPQTSYLTIDMMRDVIAEGTATSVNSYIADHGVDWVGKTGTSQNHWDAWFVGLNPNVTLSAWIGYDSNIDINRQCVNCPIAHGERVIKFWSTLVNASANINPELVTPQEKFKRPDGIVQRSYCAISGMLPSELCQKAGLVKTDLFNIKYVPTEEDDSLISGSYVTIDGKAVLAGPRTPKEFIKSDGFTFNPEFLKRYGYDELNDITELYPLTSERSLWEKISMPSGDVASHIEDTGKPPSSPTGVGIHNQTLTWNKSNSQNVIGYRIYEATKDGERFKQIDHTTNTEYNLSRKNAVYIVTAIDYFGRESKPSIEVMIGKIKQKKDPDEEKDKKDDKDSEKDENENNEPENDENNDDHDDNNNENENNNS